MFSQTYVILNLLGEYVTFNVRLHLNLMRFSELFMSYKQSNFLTFLNIYYYYFI